MTLTNHQRPTTNDQRLLIVLAAAVLSVCCGSGSSTESPAKKSAPVSGHAADHSGPPPTVAEWARGARLFDRLGTFHRAITTSSPSAQRYFDQGMRLLWAFNHDESTRSFAEAAVLDPACAMCYWG